MSHADVPLSSRREASSGQREGRQRPLPSDSSSDEDRGATAESMVDEAKETGKHSGLGKGKGGWGAGVKIKGQPPRHIARAIDGPKHIC